MAWKHYLSDMDTEARSGICALCGPVHLVRRGYLPTGDIRWSCGPAEAKRGREYWRANPRRRTHWAKKDRCESCGFVPEHHCQLDVDHIDGEHDNNDPANLQTLCANCHRLKTWKAKEWGPKKHRPPKLTIT